jgi:hypothetical protein
VITHGNDAEQSPAAGTNGLPEFLLCAACQHLLTLVVPHIGLLFNFVRNENPERRGRGIPQMPR